MGAGRKREIYIQLPDTLYKAAKAEARSQGLTISSVLALLITEWLKGSGQWREFLTQRSGTAEANAVGRIAKAKP